MRPDEVNSTPARASAAAPRQQPNGSTQNNPASQRAAAEILRHQIDSLYATPSPNAGTAATAPTPAAAQPLESPNPYDRTHDGHPQPQDEQWKQYHSAWQTYYQKYYEGYYTHHLNHAKQSLQTQADTSSKAGYFQHPEPETIPEGEASSQSLSRDEALYDLREKLLVKVQASAKKVRRSRHFVPITAALLVVCLFSFLQYNRVIVGSVMAYVTPGNIDPQNIVIDPAVDTTVGPESRLIIPKINVDVPVMYDVGNDYTSQMAAMQKGVADFAIPGASSRPGQVGNTVIAGHSSNDLLDPGDYKFIFAQLDKLEVGDSIYTNYNSRRYTYTVTKKEVVEPSQVDKLVYPTTKPVMTLLTCTPLGTALHRLLVTAEQVSPDPAASAAAPTAASTATAAIPGNSPTFLERLFGQH